MNCPICKAAEQTVIFDNPSVPAFQNKVYDTREQALACPCFPVELVQCGRCGFVWNRVFHPEAMEYDADYQNEQGLSGTFQNHLKETLGLVAEIASLDDRIVEIGCGKGVFLSMLRDAGYAVTGYDPAHEGNDPDVVKTYFSKDLDITPGDLLILRHTLEHVPDPLQFLHTIRDANQGRGKILIEVPRLEWIAENKAFWDLFHEHCNYFSEGVLALLFPHADIRRCFNGQYMWIVADLTDLADTPAPESGTAAPVDSDLFPSEISRLRDYVADNPGCILWGAGAKGIAFANQTDPESRFIPGIVDINPRKQNRFAAKTGHLICPPDALKTLGKGNIIVMNSNYSDEIRKMCKDLPNRVLDTEAIS